MISILIIEDENNIARFVMHELTHEGYEVSIINDGREGLNAALTGNYNIIILDLMLPSLAGLEILRRLRAAGVQTPVIILTARDQVMDKVTGLDVGADDYMTKPFAIEELLARIRVILKRKSETSGKRIAIGELEIDFEQHTVEFLGHSIELTKREFDLLAFLASNKNIVLSRQRILDAVWGIDYFGDANIVDVYIRYLRGKIDNKFNIKLLHTVHSVGYALKDY